MIFKKFFFSLIILFMLISSANSIENKILIKVNNEIITSLDILNELKYLEAINIQFKNTEKKQAFEIAKKSLIREKIKKIELKKYYRERKLKDQFLNNVLINYFKQFQIESISDFEKYFNSKKIDPKLVIKKITIEVMWNDLIFNKYNKRVKIDKKEIVDNLKKSDKQKEFLLSEILFNINSNENLEKKYAQIKDKIQKTNFSEAALIYSISDTSSKGGKLGWIKETSMSKKIKNSLQNIKVGDLSDPIVIPGGFLILKIVNVRKTNDSFATDEEVKRIIQEKTNDQLNQFSNIFFNKSQKNIIIDEL